MTADRVHIMSTLQIDNSEERVSMVNASTGAVPVVLACDEGYAMPLATTLRSLVDASRSEQPLQIFVLTSEFSAQLKEKVTRSLPKGSAPVRWISVDLSGFREFSTLPYISTITFARLILPSICDDSISRVLYLDADMLVIEDLSELSNQDLEGRAIAAVMDSHSVAHTARIWGHNGGNGRQSGADRLAYFNAGMLLVDVSRWRQERITEKAMQYMVDHPDTPLADQDALNVACGGDWKRLEERWNYQKHYPYGYLCVTRDKWPAIIHFAGKSKPWDASSLSVDRSFYDAFRARTAFARTGWRKMIDAAQQTWTRARYFLKRYRAIVIVYKYVKARRADAA
jgi:lipopolysaccharide biosynthesis glycosyltransferase